MTSTSTGISGILYICTRIYNMLVQQCAVRGTAFEAAQCRMLVNFNRSEEAGISIHTSTDTLPTAFELQRSVWPACSYDRVCMSGVCLLSMPARESSCFGWFQDICLMQQATMRQVATPARPVCSQQY